MKNLLNNQVSIQVIKEQRRSILMMLIVMIFLSVIMSSLLLVFPQMKSTFANSGLKEMILFATFFIIQSVASLISSLTAIHLLIKLIKPSEIVLTPEGIKGAGIRKPVKWEDIAAVEYFRIEKVYKRFFYSAVLLLSLIVVVSPITWICYVFRAFVLIHSFESQTIHVKMKNGKTYMLNFDESLGDDNQPSALNSISTYKAKELYGRKI